jgi:hypothetical protein
MLFCYFLFLFLQFANKLSCGVTLDGGLTFVGGGREVRSLKGLVEIISGSSLLSSCLSSVALPLVVDDDEFVAELICLY